MSPTAPATTVAPTLRPRRGLTEQAAVAAVDQACRRLRLPRPGSPGRSPDRRWEGTTLLSGLPGGTVAGRVRRPGPALLDPPRQSRELFPG
jgi:hypothetical protein